MDDTGTARAKVWIEKEGKPLIGKGRARLLEEIDATGSIRQAASRMGLSYRHAWDMVSRMADAFGSPVVVSFRGGREGGRSILSTEGRELLRAYKDAERGRMSGDGLPDEIACVVTEVDRSRNVVTLRSLSGDVTITIRGAGLAGRLSVDDRMSLVPR